MCDVTIISVLHASKTLQHDFVHVWGSSTSHRNPYYIMQVLAVEVYPGWSKPRYPAGTTQMEGSVTGSSLTGIPRVREVTKIRVLGWFEHLFGYPVFFRVTRWERSTTSLISWRSTENGVLDLSKEISHFYFYTRVPVIYMSLVCIYLGSTE